jgi:serine protease Do
MYGPHAAAHKAGFLKGDVVISFDGRTDLARETDLLVHSLTSRKVGDRVAVTVLRGGKKVNLMLPLQ